MYGVEDGNLGRTAKIPRAGARSGECCWKHPTSLQRERQEAVATHPSRRLDQLPLQPQKRLQKIPLLPGFFFPGMPPAALCVQPV